ncbi:GL26125 [Drosophila persimilis]|uniref:GL26125 n=1 Tax=Drosophila persimilis TaxID=7234 RepID=B4GKN9_DROPE|nr:zinc finger protein 700 [Drosophila persimilis]XP_026843728.1 zinc finger protein 700 [Drosophila persimilis]EDW37205.1 GL26125 [Drosophila persimilis]
MDSDDLDDTHLCIKCNATIVGLSKYIEHRKSNCLAAQKTQRPKTPEATSPATQEVSPPAILSSRHLDHTYDSFHFAEPEAPSSYLRKTTASHGGKSSKSLTEAYDLPYELGADLFFSSLQLQSVSTGGKTVSRPKEEAWDGSSRAAKEEAWTAARDPVLKAVREHDEAVFKPLNFVQDSPEPSDEEDEDEDDPDDSFDAEEDEAEEEYDAVQHSPPAVPATHTGGKWKPEHRPQLGHTHIERISPSWDEPAEEVYAHPPEEHTHGKWVPGSKQLEYRENIDLTKLQQPGVSYWCNICCRRLKSRCNYEQHLRSAYHLKRAEAERQLEQATLGGKLPLSKDFSPPEREEQQPTEEEPMAESEIPKRKRRAHFLRCDLCHHTMGRHLMGKHLISHYHYRRLQQQTPLRRQSFLKDILDHMGSIVRQSPFQCQPCSFYANTEEAFLRHWRSAEHLKQVQGRRGDSFWCSYCQFECESSDLMWQHMLHPCHKDVVLALNRSVPICIAQRSRLQCSACGESFLYNMQLRRHFATEHPGLPPTDTAADDYQSRFRCGICGAPQMSRLALQRHEKFKHRLERYYCGICHLEFETALEARRHRSLLQHKLRSNPKDRVAPQSDKVLERMLREVLEDQRPDPPPKKKRLVVACKQCANCQKVFDSPQALAQHRAEAHPAENHGCLICGENFHSPQALGRHNRSCQPTASTSSAATTGSSKSWSCDQCPFSCEYESDLLYHRFFHTRSGSIGRNEMLQCPRCPKRFKMYSLRAHLRTHTNEKIFECPECQMKFGRRHNLKNHIATMHSKKEKPKKEKQEVRKPCDEERPKYPLAVFGKKLANRSSQKHHEQSHASTVERSFRCHVADCTYSGATQVSLRIHLASHSQGKHKCDRDQCKYVGKSEVHLKRHLKSVHGKEQDNWFPCDQCEFRARSKDKLRRHSISHSDERRHKCPHCIFRCKNIDNLRKHVMKTTMHPGKFMYECKKCSEQKSKEIYKTNNYQEYKRHLTTHQKN